MQVSSATRKPSRSHQMVKRCSITSASRGRPRVWANFFQIHPRLRIDDHFMSRPMPPLLHILDVSCATAHGADQTRSCLNVRKRWLSRRSKLTVLEHENWKVLDSE